MDASQWISAVEAAPLLRVTIEQLNEHCSADLCLHGLAVKRTEPRTRCKAWFIARVTNPALAPIDRAASDVPPCLDAYTPSQIDMAHQRAACVARYRLARAIKSRGWFGPLMTDLRREYPQLGISRSTLYRWVKKYDRPADLVLLIDARGGDRRSRGTPNTWRYFRRQYLRENGPSLRACWQRTREWAEAKGEAWCSYSACRRQAKRRWSESERTAARDPQSYRRYFAPTISRKSRKSGENGVAG